MDFTYTDKNYIEKGFLNYASIDFEDGILADGNIELTSTTNTFQISMNYNFWNTDLDNGSLVFADDSEWGGIVQRKKSDTKNGTITLTGLTARGLLSKEFVQPINPSTQAYYNATGEANTVINAIISERFDSLVTVDNIGASGITVNASIRDNNLLYALEKMLLDQGARLSIKWSSADVANDIKPKIHIEAVKINNLSKEVSFDNDYGIALIATETVEGFNHVIALGKGELTERTRINIYRKKDGTYTTDANEQGVKNGLERKTYKYDDSSVESESDLYDKAIAKLEETWTDSSLDVTLSDVDVNINDVIAAKETTTGISMEKSVTQKILKGNIKGKANTLNISYKVGE